MASFTARALAGKGGLFSGIYGQQFQACQKSFGSLSYMSQQKLQAPKPASPLLQKNILGSGSGVLDVTATQKRNIFMGFDPVGTTGLLYALSVGSAVFLPALMTAQTGPDRVSPLCGYEEEPKEEPKELTFGRLPKNHAHGSFLFMGGNGHAYNAVVRGYGAGIWDLWVDSAFDAKNKTQLALAPLPPLMVSILVLNLAGLIPYMVPMTSAPVALILPVLPCLSVCIWSAQLFHGWFNTPKDMLAHLVPVGTPNALMPAMVLIESISQLIRPLTLTVRLGANMTAGHVLLALCSEGIESGGAIGGALGLLAQTAFMGLELAVCCIQAYVYVTLCAQWGGEIPPKGGH